MGGTLPSSRRLATEFEEEAVRMGADAGPAHDPACEDVEYLGPSAQDAVAA